MVYFPFQDRLIKREEEREILSPATFIRAQGNAGKSYRIKVVSVAVRRLILCPRKRIKSRFPPPVAARDYLACNGRRVCHDGK